ncbi:putative DNA modification/repair radical SAM protein [uncultured Gemmiger sp.]|uniref:putative DNA modification/repair radical SAM protein n=1 Tax=uncultured Gemmiger sp. TaxID=1623490 RepID=UPI0026006F72|nr:putative DNA modification/repair radical SAM protein [uncultured Gemmiger sp.]
MDLAQKLEILADSAKYDVACTSSGVDRPGRHGALGSCCAAGICHAFTPDGRCVSLLKVLYSNACSYDCSYCVNRRTNDIPRATFTPRELADLTIGFYRRNYIEGLFLSSAVLGSPDVTMEKMIEALRILRQEYHFNGYIHAKAIPGADPLLVERLGLLADRLSVNIELPSEASLGLLAPDKHKAGILRPMGQIAQRTAQNRREMAVYRHTPAFAPAGQSTQMIIGATPENDLHILRLTEGLYKKYALKRVFFSAYLPVVPDPRLPATTTRPPLLREHRLYQADWLLRYYQFSAAEILNEDEPNFDPYLDPKCNWALRHPEFFPVEVNTATKAQLLRVPGIGPKSVQRILAARRQQHLGLEELKRIGVVLKRARYFITCNGKAPVHGTRAEVAAALLDPNAFGVGMRQLSLDDFVPAALPGAAPLVHQLTDAGMDAREAARLTRQEALTCLTKRL